MTGRIIHFLTGLCGDRLTDDQLFIAGYNSASVKDLVEKYAKKIKDKVENQSLGTIDLKGFQEEMTVEVLEQLKHSMPKWMINLIKNRKKCLSILARVLYWGAICQSGYCLVPEIPNGLCFDVAVSKLGVVPNVGITVEDSTGWLEETKNVCNLRGRRLVIEIVDLLRRKTVEKFNEADLMIILRNAKFSLEKRKTDNDVCLHDEEETEDEKPICAICLAFLDEGCVDSPCVQCRYAFHEVCLLSWREVSNTCPLCRRNF